jgi:hypothetical protein
VPDNACDAGESPFPHFPACLKASDFSNSSSSGSFSSPSHETNTMHTEHQAQDDGDYEIVSREIHLQRPSSALPHSRETRRKTRERSPNPSLGYPKTSYEISIKLDHRTECSPAISALLT